MNVTAPSKVRMLFDDGVCEEVRVVFVGDCQCRLEQTPLASATDVRLGDVIEFDPDDGIAKMKRIVQRSPFEMLTLLVPATGDRSKRFLALLTDAERDGCRIEGAYGGTILVHVPPSKKEAIRSLFEVADQGS